MKISEELARRKADLTQQLAVTTARGEIVTLLETTAETARAAIGYYSDEIETTVLTAIATTAESTMRSLAAKWAEGPTGPALDPFCDHAFADGVCQLCEGVGR